MVCHLGLLPCCRAGQLLTQAPLSPGDGFVFGTQPLEDTPVRQPASEAAAQAPVTGLQRAAAGDQQQQPSVTGSLQGSVAHKEGAPGGEAVTSRSPVQLPFRLLSGWVRLKGGWHVACGGIRVCRCGLRYADAQHAVLMIPSAGTWLLQGWTQKLAQRNKQVRHRA